MRSRTFRHFIGHMVLAGVWLYLLLQTANWLCNGKVW